jgi:hypothetical protein
MIDINPGYRQLFKEYVSYLVLWSHQDIRLKKGIAEEIGHFAEPTKGG